MRVTESIKELRRISQQSREDEFYHMPWLERNFTRRISIYLTKLFLEIGISANQATSIGFIIMIAGGVFLLFPSPIYWFIGIALLVLYTILGTVDGEIARYNKTASPEGAFWNSIPERFFVLYMPICISFGIYHTVYSIFPFIFGFVAAMSYYLSTCAILLPYPLLHAKGLLSEALGSAKTANSEEHASTIVRWGYLLFDEPLKVLFGLLICSIVDCFISPFNIGSLSFNARYIYFIIYTLALLANAIRNIYLPLHTGVKLRL